MSYAQALQAAGAQILAFEEFGSYQGDWWAKVIYQGETGWVSGSYGSCSGCDSFQAEFGWDETSCTEHPYNHRADCGACAEAEKQYNARLADFGRGYLGGLLTQEKAEADAMQNISWDSDAGPMLAWIKSQA